MAASVQPYHSGSASYLDLTNASTLDATAGQSLRVDPTSYDGQGRVSCAITRAALPTIPFVVE